MIDTSGVKWTDSDFFSLRQRPDPDMTAQVVFLGSAFMPEEEWRLYPKHEEILNRYLSLRLVFQSSCLSKEEMPFIGFHIDRDERCGPLYIEGSLFLDPESTADIYRYMDLLEGRPEKSDETYDLLAERAQEAVDLPARLVVQGVSVPDRMEDLQPMFQEGSDRLWQFFYGPLCFLL